MTSAFRYISPADLRARHGKPALAVEHSATSRTAAARIEPRRGTLRARVYDAISQSNGLTDEEGIEATGIAPSTYRPRRVELMEANVIEDRGRTRKTKSGRSAVVWEACP